MNYALAVSIALCIIMAINLVYQLVYKMLIRKRFTSIGYKRMLHALGGTVSIVILLASKDTPWPGISLAPLPLLASILCGISTSQVPHPWVEMGWMKDNRKKISDGKTRWEKIKIGVWY